MDHMDPNSTLFKFQSIIYYTLRSPKLDEWLENSAIKEALKPCADKNFADLVRKNTVTKFK
jgi:hypothetical protein